MENVPGWVQLVFVLSALATAIGVLWKKVFYPFGRMVSVAEIMLPLLQDLTVKFRDVPHWSSILKEIVAQVRTDSGSSIKDTVNKLDAMIEGVKQTLADIETKALASAEVLHINLEADRKLSERDREQVSRLLREQDRLMDRMENFEKSALVIAQNLATAQKAVDSVATELVVAQKTVDAVATDLAASHERADAVSGDPPGAAADAASQSPAS